MKEGAAVSVAALTGKGERTARFRAEVCRAVAEAELVVPMRKIALIPELALSSS